MPFAGYSVAVKHFTGGLHHPCAAHIVGGFRYRLLRTALMVLGQVGVTASTEMGLSALMAMPNNLSAAAFLVGYVLAALVFGLALDQWRHRLEALIALGLACCSVGLALVAFIPQPLLMAAFHVQGLGAASADVCNNYMTLRLWNKDATTPMCVLHAGAALGRLIAFFLSRRSALPEGSFAENMTEEVNATRLDPLQLRANLWVTGLSLSLILLLLAAAHMAVHVYERIKIHQFSGEIVHHVKASRGNCSCLMALSPAACTGGRSTFGLVFFALLMAYSFNAKGAEKSYRLIIYSQGHASPEWTAGDVEVDMTIWLCSLLVSASISSMTSLWLHPNRIIHVLLGTQTLSTLFLLLCCPKPKVTAWVLTAVYAHSLGSLFPIVLTWAHLYVDMRSTALAAMWLSGLGGSAVFLRVSMELLPIGGQRPLLVIHLAHSVAMDIIFLVMHIIASKQGERSDALDVQDLSEIDEELEGRGETEESHTAQSEDEPRPTRPILKKGPSS